MTTVWTHEQLALERAPAASLMFPGLVRSTVEPDPFDSQFEHWGHIWSDSTASGRDRLVDGRPRTCRFCGVTAHEGARFKKLAHVLPQAFLGRRLTTESECDSCNHEFGVGPESDLAAFLEPYRVMAAVPVPGKGPKYRRKPGSAIGSVGRGQRHLKIDVGDNTGDVRLEQIPDDPDAALLRVRTRPYNPANVGRALGLMALRILTKERLNRVEHLRQWVRGQGTHAPIVKSVYIKDYPATTLGLSVFGRRAGLAGSPSMVVSFTFAQQTLVWFAPDLSMDRPSQLPLPIIGKSPLDGAHPAVGTLEFGSGGKHDGETILVLRGPQAGGLVPPLPPVVE